MGRIHSGGHQRTPAAMAGTAHLELLRVHSTIGRSVCHFVLWSAGGQLLLSSCASERRKRRSAVAKADQPNVADNDDPVRDLDDVRGHRNWIAHGAYRVYARLRCANARAGDCLWAGREGTGEEIHGEALRA